MGHWNLINLKNNRCVHNCELIYTHTQVQFAIMDTSIIDTHAVYKEAM